MPFTDLVGKTLTMITSYPAEMLFYCSDGSIYRMYHEQDCCEYVSVEDVTGDLDNLLGSPILTAEERTSVGGPKPEHADYGTCTWTFYELATIKGSVTIRWYGSSNGYYSESVTFKQLNPVLD